MAVDLREAFQEFNMLNEDTFTIDDNGIAELKAFEIEDAKAPETEVVIDPLAETEKDLEDSYMGNVILECDICKSKIFKKPEEVVINEEDNLANEDEECPYCFTPGGFKVIGQVTEYCPHYDHEDEEHTDIEIDTKGKEVEIESEEEIDESIKTRKGMRKMSSLKEADDKNVYEIKTEQGHLFKIKASDEAEAREKVMRDFRPTIQGAFDIASVKKLDGTNIFTESDKPAAISIEDAQKWVDYDMKKYGRISGRTNRLVKKAGFQILKDDHGDYEVAAGKFESVNEEVEKVDIETESDRDYRLNMNEALDSELKKKARLGFNKAKHYLEKKYPYIDVGSLFIDESEISAENEEGSMTFSILPEDMNLEKALTLMANPNNYVWFGPDALNDEKLSNQWSYMNLDADYIKKYPKAYNVMENAGLHLIGDPYIKDVEPEFLIKVNLNTYIDRDDKKKNLKEEIENISIETEDQKITVTSEDKECEEHTDDKDEMIEPVDSEKEEKFKDIDIDEFDEESFDTLGENYLKKVYDNVESFKTSQGKVSGNKLILEGIITFKSGKQGKTSFIFEARSCNSKGKVKFLGENKQFAKGDKAFTIEGNISNKKLIVENFRYNYRAKDANGESKHVYGNIRK